MSTQHLLSHPLSYVLNIIIMCKVLPYTIRWLKLVGVYLPLAFVNIV